MEIHWDITAGHNPSLVRSNVSNLMEIWWSRASNAETGFAHVYALHPVDLISLVASHFFKHRFIKQNSGFATNGSLLQLLDIMNIVCYYHDEITWEGLKADSKQVGLYSTVSVALWIVETIFRGVIDERSLLLKNLLVEQSELS